MKMIIMVMVNDDDDEIEIQKMLNLKAIIIPVVVGPLGMIKKKTEDYIKRIPGNHCLQELQKIVFNGMAHLLRRVLSMWPNITFLQN